MYNNRGNNMLIDEHGQMLTSIEEKLTEWTRYIGALYNDERRVIHGIVSSDGLDITRAELERALSTTKNGKAPGPDEIHIEVIKILKEDRVIVCLLSLFNSIYKTGIILHDWLKSTFVALPKKPNAKQCNDYRNISLMSHVLKLFLKIIHSRIHRKCEQNMGDTQFGFRNGFGTREALFGVQVLAQRCRDVNVDIHMCFIDYERVFDSVQHDKLLEVLNKIELDRRDIRIIANQKYYQSTTVRVERWLTEEILYGKVFARDVFFHRYYSIYTLNIYFRKLWMKEWKA